MEENVEQFPTTSNIKHYFGLYLGYCVKIIDHEEGLDLYKHGCFGKGNLSRSTPIYDKIKNNLSFTGFHSKKPKPPLQKKRNRDENNNNIDKLKNNTDTKERLKFKKLDNNTNTEYIDISNLKDIKKDNDGSENLSMEYLQLNLCEAFFLCYSLGCLTILREPSNIDELKEEEKERECNNNNEKEKDKITLYRMSIIECWSEFIKSDQHFIENYVVYQYFRSQGWIPRSGLKYGCDYVLYKLKPELIHAQYGVVIQRYNSSKQQQQQQQQSKSHKQPDQLNLMGHSKNLSNSWEDIIAINRVSESVAKGIIICNAISPFHENTMESLKIENLSKYTINLWNLNRWIPAKTRE